jgi:hypothetical protein
LKQAILSSDHYAGSWEVATEETLNKVEDMNALGIRYASLPDGEEREEVMLQIVRSFHSYLCKYLAMIVKGHLPPLKSSAGKEATTFLKTLIPKGTTSEAGRLVLMNVCRTLHLAFKQMTSDDIYDTLVLCLMRAVKKYDPFYTDKVKRVCNAIDKRFPNKSRASKRAEFTTDELSKQLGFDCVGCLRLLVRKEYLQSIVGPKKKVIGYRRAKAWPPPSTFLNSGPVGFTYFLPMYFRYYLHEYISGAMSEIESKEHVLQLDYRYSERDGMSRPAKDLATPHTGGDYVDRDGYTWAADIGLMNLPLDVSPMTLDWVKSTDDKLFRKLTQQERHLLYMIFVQELKLVEAASILGCEPATVRKQLDQILDYLQARSNPRRK